MIDWQYTIVSEEMVWLFYYDELRQKHLKEIYGREAREFIINITNQKDEPIANFIKLGNNSW